MSDPNNSLEFRFFYFTPRYSETISFYKDLLQLEVFRSWDRGNDDKGTIFKSPNGTGLIEIELGTEVPVIQGELYIQVANVDLWYKKLVDKNITMVSPITNTSYGHRSFKFADPNKLIIGFFNYNDI